MQMKLLDKSRDRRYFTIIPNFLWVSELGLTAMDFKLYATIKKVAGESGECFMSTRTLAAEAGISMGAVSASKGRLEDAGLIIIVAKRRRNGGQPVDHISIVDIWQRNMEHFVACDKRSSGEHSDTSVHQVNALAVERSSPERKRSPGETEEEPLNKNQEVNKRKISSDFSSLLAEDVWDRAKEDLQLQMTSATFDQLLKKSEVKAVENGVLVVGVVNQAAVDWCTHRLGKVIGRALVGVVGEKREVKFEVAERG